MHHRSAANGPRVDENAAIPTAPGGIPSIIPHVVYIFEHWLSELTVTSRDEHFDE
jgi:hypothetical protein